MLLKQSAAGLVEWCLVCSARLQASVRLNLQWPPKGSLYKTHHASGRRG
jgi:hypothetical protein